MSRFGSYDLEWLEELAQAEKENEWFRHRMIDEALRQSGEWAEPDIGAMPRRVPEVCFTPPEGEDEQREELAA